MPRLFTALEVPPHVAESLARMRGGVSGARWIDVENYHITLRFIGDVDDRFAHDAANAYHVGDTVRIEESRPLSKRKHWVVLGAVGEAAGRRRAAAAEATEQGAEPAGDAA